MMMPRLTLLALIGLLLTACATAPGYRQLRQSLDNGDCDAAVAMVEAAQKTYGDNSELLYLMDSGMVYLQCGGFDTAQARFQEAVNLADALWTKSITRNAASFLTSDYLLKYPGEDFERVLIHLMAAVGFILNGQRDAALVECRRLDSLLTLYNSKYAEKNVYKQDAFARYLSGMLNEDDNAPDDAFIDYLLAVRAYDEYRDAYGTPMPASLREDLLRMATVVDRMDDARNALHLPETDTPPDLPDTAGMGKVVFIAFSGEAPRKVEDRLVVPTTRGPITVAFPRMVAVDPACGGGQLSFRSDGPPVSAQAALAQDINRIAVKNLADRKGRVIAKTVARAVAKQILIEGVSRQANSDGTQADIAALLNILNLFIERADVRSWRTLPAEIHMARVFLPAGTYAVDVSRCGASSRTIAGFHVAAGETRFLVSTGSDLPPMADPDPSERP